MGEKYKKLDSTNFEYSFFTSGSYYFLILMYIWICQHERNES